ncbi:fluoride efflux transporter CrcB, partial [bacterium]|nr:fluoride efflux transporter CrcB [bacterium]
MKFLFLLIGGMLGTLLRYVFSGIAHRILGIGFPYGTFIVNIVGCFFLGFLAVAAEEKFLLDTNMKVFLMVGFCGAFTTFSTFMLETSNLIRDGQNMTAF